MSDGTADDLKGRAKEAAGSLSDDAAALLEPLSVGIWACRKGRVRAGSRVLVTGAGPVGLVAAQSALALGAAAVTVTDVNPHRRLRLRRGRIATPAAYRHLGITPPKVSGADLFGE